MATTTYNNWTTPNDNDYLKLGAEAIRTLGNGADTTVYNNMIAQLMGAF